MLSEQVGLRKRKNISEAFALAAITLLILDTVNTFTSQDGIGILSLADRQSGIYLGLPSIFLFFLSFGFGFRQKTTITTSLLILGGGLLAISKIIEPALGLNLYLAIALPYVYLSLITIGFILLALGLWNWKTR
jgi:hypothetical protein